MPESDCFSDEFEMKTKKISLASQAWQHKQRGTALPQTNFFSFSLTIEFRINRNLAWTATDEFSITSIRIEMNSITFWLGLICPSLGPQL